MLTAWLRAARHRAPRRLGTWLLIALVAACILVPEFSKYHADATVGIPLEGPSSAHLLGTDSLGRDVLTRLFVAGRLDLTIAVLGVAVSCVAGTLLGVLVASAAAKWPDWLMQRVIDGLIAFPFIILSLTLVLVLGPAWKVGPFPAGAPSTLLAIWLINWTLYARLARTETLSLVESDFVVAAKLLGYSRWRVVTRHLLPIVTRTTATIAAGDALLIVGVVAALPFLGAGVQPPNSEWGVMMYEGRSFLSQAPVLVVAPVMVLLWFGIGLTLTVDRWLNALSGVDEGGLGGAGPQQMHDAAPTVLTELSHG